MSPRPLCPEPPMGTYDPDHVPSGPIASVEDRIQRTVELCRCILTALTTCRAICNPVAPFVGKPSLIRM